MRAYSYESPDCVKMLEAVIDHMINAIAARPGEVGLLLGEEFHWVWQEVEELDLAVLRTALMHSGLLLQALSPAALGPAMRGTLPALLP